MGIGVRRRRRKCARQEWGTDEPGNDFACLTSFSSIFSRICFGHHLHTPFKSTCRVVRDLPHLYAMVVTYSVSPRAATLAHFLPFVYSAIPAAFLLLSSVFFFSYQLLLRIAVALPGAGANRPILVSPSSVTALLPTLPPFHSFSFCMPPLTSSSSQPSRPRLPA